VEEKKARSVKEIVEQRLLPVLAVIVIFAGAIRSAAAWSEGTFNLSLLPTPVVHTLDAVIGVSLAALMEMVMVLAGIQWLAEKRAQLEAEFDPGLPAQQRKMQAADHKGKAKTAVGYAWVGAICSVFGQMYFAFTQSLNPSKVGIALNLVEAILVTVCVFYVFVIHQPIREDITKSVQNDMLCALRGILGSIGERIRSNTHDNRDVRTLQKALPHGQKRMLEALITQDANESMWDVGTIATRLGMDTESGRRSIRRAIAGVKDDVTYGVSEKQTGRGYEMPMSQAIRLFQAEFEARMVIAGDRTPTGEYGNEKP
jgi:hypothetical protein